MSIFLLFVLKLFNIDWVVYHHKKSAQNYYFLLWLLTTYSKQKTNIKYCSIFWLVQSTSWKTVSLYFSFKSTYVYIQRNVITTIELTNISTYCFNWIFFHTLLQLNSERVQCLWFLFGNIFYKSKKVSNNIQFDFKIFFYKIETTNGILLIT